jgi:calcium channel MID1
VHSLPYCPAVAYSVPLPPPQSPSTSYISTNLPSNISDPLIAYIGNFTASLLTFACGRDIYSPVQSCYDCQAAYREWACAVSFPRCAEAPQNTLARQPALVSYTGTDSSRSLNMDPLGSLLRKSCLASRRAFKWREHVHHF